MPGRQELDCEIRLAHRAENLHANGRWYGAIVAPQQPQRRHGERAQRRRWVVTGMSVANLGQHLAGRLGGHHRASAAESGPKVGLVHRRRRG